jgi:hypothetical protein
MSDKDTHRIETPFAKIRAPKGTRAATPAEVEKDRSQETSPASAADKKSGT